MRRRMNKVMAAMLIGAMTASLALTGCGGKKSASKDGKKELTVWAWDVALKQLEEAAEEYQKDHPDVTFKFEEMGTDQIYKKNSLLPLLQEMVSQISSQSKVMFW